MNTISDCISKNESPASYSNSSLNYRRVNSVEIEESKDDNVASIDFLSRNHSMLVNINSY